MDNTLPLGKPIKPQLKWIRLLSSCISILFVENGNLHLLKGSPVIHTSTVPVWISLQVKPGWTVVIYPLHSNFTGTIFSLSLLSYLKDQKFLWCFPTKSASWVQFFRVLMLKIGECRWIRYFFWWGMITVYYFGGSMDDIWSFWEKGQGVHYNVYKNYHTEPKMGGRTLKKCRFFCNFLNCNNWAIFEL